MMEVGEAISSMMKVCGATKSTLIKVSGNLIMSVVIDVRRYISWWGENYYIGWRRCVAHQSYDGVWSY